MRVDGVASYRPLAGGFVASGVLAAASRVVVTNGGLLVCAYMVRSGAGISDFVPHLSVSGDDGRTWEAPRVIWPDLVGVASISCALSRSRAGELFLYGTTTPIERPGETWWDGARQAMKQNDIFWARSTDDGRTWTAPTVIPMPIPGGAEAPGPLTVLRSGRWLACYAPYNTFDESVVVDRNQIVLVMSDDTGRSWRHTSMLRFEDPDAGGAEAWVVQMADGRLVGTSWSMSLVTGADTPIPYALSSDDGTTWTTTRSTGIRGQATSLAPLHGGGVLMAYNQRQEPSPGVWLAVAEPSDAGFGVKRIGPAWLAEKATHTAAGTGHDEWTDFAFGEPSVTLLPDGDVFLTLWCDQPTGRGIRYVRLAGETVFNDPPPAAFADPFARGDR